MALRKRKKKWPENESDLAKVIVNWLVSQQWDVYQEVRLAYGGIRADIVAVKDTGKLKLVWVIECKTGMNLEVIKQAHEWSHYAHIVSVAIVDRERSKIQGFGEQICRLFGIGCLIGNQHGFVQVTQSPQVNKKAMAKKLLGILRPEHKSFGEAGNASHEYYTPFRGTALQVQQIVQQEPGITFSELMNKLKHHYRTDTTARSCLKKYIESGVIAGIKIEKVGRSLCLFPKPLCDVLESGFGNGARSASSSRIEIIEDL